MSQIYQCPSCKKNRSKFSFIYKLAQEVRKDPDNGATLYYSDELETLTAADGQPDLDMRCTECGYAGPEAEFTHRASPTAPQVMQA